MDDQGHEYQKVLSDLAGPAKDLRSHIPDVWRAFAELSKSAVAEGELSGGTKELIAIAIAVARECDGCIANHARSAVRKGVTPQQMAEMLGVAVLMLGGPGTVYGPRAWEAFLEFYAAAHPEPALG